MNVLITGASRGLGRALAEELHAQGHQLALVARNAKEIQQVAEPLGALAIAADVGQQAEEIVAQTIRHLGRIDVLINNASALGPMGPLQDVPWEALREVLRTNVLAPLHLAQLVLPGMRERKSGLLVNITSDAGFEAYPGWGAYGLSKAALEHQSRTWGAELEGSGVGVLLVDPGDMATAMHREAVPDADFSQLAQPRDVASRLVPLLASQTGFARVRA